MAGDIFPNFYRLFCNHSSQPIALCLNRSVACVYYLLEILDFGLQKLDEIRIAILKLAIDCVQSKIQNLKGAVANLKKLLKLFSATVYKSRCERREPYTSPFSLQNKTSKGRCPLGAWVLYVTGT